MTDKPNTIALITGGTSGIGAACAKRFAARGFDCLLTYRQDDKKAEEIKQLLESEYGVQVETVAGDLAEPENVDKVFEVHAERLNNRPVELFMHCAGLYLAGKMHHHLAGAMDFESYDYYQALYPKCFVRFVEKILPDMPDGRGRITSLSSAGSNIIHRPRLGYDLPGQAKATLEVMNRYYALHLAPRGITSNIVLPGFTATDGWAGVGMNREALQEMANKASPMKAVLEPEDVAEVVDFLMSHKGRYITGMNLSVDGGGHLT